MANVEHSALTDPDLHEPKGAADAAANQIYVADGSGSGAFTTVNNLNLVYMSAGHELDIGGTSPEYTPMPVAGDIVKIWSVIDSALTTADAVMTAKINGTAITGGSWTIAFTGSAAGDIDSATPTAANTVAAGDYLSIESNGGPANNPAASFVIAIDVS